MDQTSKDSGRTQATLSDQLARARSASFVGRESELAAFKELLGPDPDFRFLFVIGERGVGKTTLLQAMQRVAEGREVQCHCLDARDLPGTPEAMEEVLDQYRPVNGRVLLLDTFEWMAAHERWFRESYLPCLPSDLRVVIAGCWRPEPAWFTDAGWSAMTRTAWLGDFSRAETAEYLSCHNVQPAVADEVHRFTGGHPLALALAASLLRQDPERALEFESMPEVVRGLVGLYLERVAVEWKRHALFAISLTSNLSESMLSAMLDVSDARELFDWLQQQVFVHRGPRGLRLHERIGEALRVELKWRNPDLHQTWVRRAGDYLARKMANENSEAAVQDYLFTIRDLPAIRQIFVVPQDTGLTLDVATEADSGALAEMIEQHEGAEARAWFHFWFERQPGELLVLRGEDRNPEGLVFYLDVTTPDRNDLTDPAVRALSGYLARYAPLRGDEKASLCRFVMAKKTYQSPSPAMTQLLSYNALRAFRKPDLAFQASVRREDGNARVQARYANVPPLEGCEFSCEGLDYFLMGHDWRVEPPAQWLRNVTERVLAWNTRVEDEAVSGVVLDYARFGEAIEEALKDYANGRTLGDNPVTGSCLVRSFCGTGREPAQVLMEVLVQAVGEMRQNPATRTAGRVLERTYIHPAPKQRLAAEALNLSYGTYRRRLRGACRLLVDRLWRREIESARVLRERE